MSPHLVEKLLKGIFINASVSKDKNPMTITTLEHLAYIGDQVPRNDNSKVHSTVAFSSRQLKYIEVRPRYYSITKCKSDSV